MEGNKLSIGSDFNSEIFVVEPSTWLWNNVRSVKLHEGFGIDDGNVHLIV
jgi:hypothetical protein